MTLYMILWTLLAVASVLTKATIIMSTHRTCHILYVTLHNITRHHTVLMQTLVWVTFLFNFQ